MAREEFIKCESSERLRRALDHNTRSSSVNDLENGQEAFYKRNDSSEWHGPGIVIGRDGKQVLVRHGGVHIRVHTCRLLRTINDTATRLSHSDEQNSNDIAAVNSTNEDDYPPQEDDEGSCEHVSMEGVTDSHPNSIIAPQVRLVQMAPKIGQRIQ